MRKSNCRQEFKESIIKFFIDISYKFVLRIAK